MTDNLVTCVDPYWDSFAQKPCRRQIYGGDDQDLPSSRAEAGAASGEGPRREAQPAARSRPRTAVCQRQGSGRARRYLERDGVTKDG
jgi:hypothetical protein